MPERNLTTVMESRMPAETVRVLRDLGRVADERGAAALVVGGVVRDLLLGVPTGDLDIVVTEPAVDFGRAAAGALGGEVKAVTRFGTALLALPGGVKVDLATARSEVYERPGALPTVSGGTMDDDLLRRDFTLNSLAVAINEGDFGRLIDRFGGLADLERGVLRVLTGRSFEDDPTRTLRAVRLSARYGFRLEDGTRRLLERAVRDGCLATVTGERLLNEIVLILREPAPWPAAERLSAWGILAGIDEAWTGAPSEPVFAELARMLHPESGPALAPDAEPWVAFFAALLDAAPRERRGRVLDRLAAPRRLRDAARQADELDGFSGGRLGAADEMRRSEVRRLLDGFGPDALVLGVARRPGSVAAARIRLFVEDIRHVRAELSGSDVIAMGVAPGPAVGRVLSAVLDAKLDGLARGRAGEESLARESPCHFDTGNKAC